MLTSYQQRITNFYTARTDYDNDFTRDRALHHLEYAVQAQVLHNLNDVRPDRG